MRLATILTFIVGLIMTGCNAKAANTNVEVVSPKEFQTRLNGNADAYLLDVRKPGEYAAGHLNGAHLLNWLDAEGFKQGVKKLDKSKIIYVYCRSGRRSNEAARYLAGMGFRVVDLDGGIFAWNENGLPSVKESDKVVKHLESQGIKLDSVTTKSGKIIKDNKSIEVKSRELP